MLQWSSLHPYNAVHVYKLAGPLQIIDLTAAVDDVFRCQGLGIAHLSADGQTFRHETDLHPGIESLASGEDPESTVRAYVGRSLNRPFERPVSHPFRFAAIDAGPRQHYVILAYDHWVADNYAARLLLQMVLGRYLGHATAEVAGPLDLYPGTYREVFRRRLHGVGLLLAALRAIRHWNRNRSAWRVACWSNTQWDVDYRLYPTIPGTVARLREFARANGATVNDVLLAAFGRALAEIMPSRGRRRGLALGSIVDTRNIAGEDLDHTLGAFLGYYIVRNNPDMSIGLDAVTRQIAERTRPIKKHQRYLDSLVNMQFINTLWPWLSTHARRHFMRKSLPISGGMSNLVIRDGWMNKNRDLVLDYYRGVSTGPSAPIILSPTTFDDHLSIGVSYRVAGFSSAKIETLMALFREQIEHPNKASRNDLRRPQVAQPAVERIAPRLQEASLPTAES